jgi:hypothetical protein
VNRITLAERQSQPGRLRFSKAGACLISSGFDAAVLIAAVEVRSESFGVLTVRRFCSLILNTSCLLTLTQNFHYRLPPGPTRIPVSRMRRDNLHFLSWFRLRAPSGGRRSSQRLKIKLDGRQWHAMPLESGKQRERSVRRFLADGLNRASLLPIVGRNH